MNWVEMPIHVRTQLWNQAKQEKISQMVKKLLNYIFLN